MIVLIVGCTTTQPEATPEAAPAETTKAPAETVLEEMIEEVTKPLDLEVIVAGEGFESNDIEVTPGSRITIINDEIVMHKLNGGDFFKAQFNTHLKSIYGNKDPLERNKLKVSILNEGEYEIKDLTTSDVLRIISK
jgi:dihydroxyacetone kinase-like predicted kinase